MGVRFGGRKVVVEVGRGPAMGSVGERVVEGTAWLLGVGGTCPKIQREVPRLSAPQAFFFVLFGSFL